MEERVIEIEKHLDVLKDSFLKLSGLIGRSLEIIQKSNTSVEERLENIESKLDTLKGNSDHTIVSLESGLNEIKAEIQKINDVTSYESIFVNSRRINENPN